ncbi:hypothetical protein RUM43_014426 [Polyplax serrata]|uniref:C2H2-type domain-containing protein n=1 Tax=Polyplax serrata TaxID=468196 RepID=A0AAN8S2M9_POLSC
MSPSDKIMAGTNSTSGDGQGQKGSKSTSGMSSGSTSDDTVPGTISSIPLITASLPTLKCSINYQMKAFDPGEESSNERLTNNHCGNSVLAGKSSCSSMLKNGSRNYKAGSKINKLADMLAKRSQNLVETTQSGSSDAVSDTSITSEIQNTVSLNNISDIGSFEKTLNNPIGFDKTANGKELDVFRKSRRKSVPNQSCNLNQLHIQSISKSCLDFSKLFLMEDVKPEINALGESLDKLQTDESTKRKSIRKNLKNVELTQILPEKKRRFSTRNENHSNKINEKMPEEDTEGNGAAAGNDKNSSKPNETSVRLGVSPVRGVSGTHSRRESRWRQKGVKRLVETSTQTADIEFITVVKPNHEEVDVTMTEKEGKPSTTASECFGCSQNFAVDRETKSQKNSKSQIKCQHCSRKFPSVDELKSHYIKKHPEIRVSCIKCDASSALTGEKTHPQNRGGNLEVKSDEPSRTHSVEETVFQEKRREEKQVDRSMGKQTPCKADLKVDVSFDSSKKSSISPRSVQKCSPKEIKTEEQLLEMEMLFYSHLSGNIRENLTNHLDGKIDKNGCPTSTDKLIPPSESALPKQKGVNLLSVVTYNSGSPDTQTTRAPSPYKTRSKTPNPLPPTAKKFKKLPNWQQKFWEKYNFPTNYRYEHRFWDKNYLNTEKSALYLKDLSCLDIKTQLTLKENVKKLENVKLIEEQMKPLDTLKFPDYLALIPKIENDVVEHKLDFSESQLTGKGKKTNRKEKEDLKRAVKSSELPNAKTRRDTNAESKRQTERVEAGKMMTRRQNSVEQTRENADENNRRRKGSLDLSCNQKMVLRRQTSADGLQKNNNTDKVDKLFDVGSMSASTSSETALPSPTDTTEISGEWVKPRSYLCGTCCTKFTNLWDLEDHKWVSHPNVWCTHYEFEDEKIDKLFQESQIDGKDVELNEMSAVKLADLYKRYLLPHGSLKTAKLVPATNFPEKCTKCKKNCSNSSEMHKHMLDCGGDTTWFLTMYSSPMTMKRKWRPFGSRRRKLGRRDLKRNITNSANLRPYHYHNRIRTKPGDVESIQKMLANLPEKRARRAINFDEIKTRSQATIHSNRLLRKRFKSSFANNFLKLKTLKQTRPLKPVKKEGSSKSTTDTSSDSTPVGSPKRRNKLKENLQVLKRDGTDDSFTESSSDCVITTKGKDQTKKNEFVFPSTHQKKDGKKNNKKKNQEGETVKADKPLTRSNSSLSISYHDKNRKKAAEPKVQEVSVNTLNLGLKEEKEVLKTSKKSKKVTNENTTGIRESEVVATEAAQKATKGKKDNTKKSSKNIKVIDAVPVNSENEANEVLSTQNNIVLRLRHSTKEKTDLVKRMQKKLKNSKRILEMKETKKCQNENRRSQRLKSLRVDSTGEMTGNFVVDEEIFGVNNSTEETKQEKSIKAKKSTVQGEETRSPQTENSVIVSHVKEEDDLPAIETAVRRSSRSVPGRKSVEENSDKICQNGITKNSLSRNSKNLLETTGESNAIENSLNKKLQRTQSHDKGLKSPEKKPNLLNLQEVSPTSSRDRFQSLRSGRSREKLIDLEPEKSSDSSRNTDLEEMPILAKVEPIPGKFLRKREQDIPILMPVVDEAQNKQGTSIGKRNINADDEANGVSFEIVKRLRKTSKEVAPLKIIKKIDNASGDGNSVVSICKKEKSNSCDSFLPGPSESGTGKRNLVKKESFQLPESKRYKSSSSINKYFLGINPCEIDKGRRTDNDESGSDSEPLITFVHHSYKSSGSSINSHSRKDQEVTTKQTEGETTKKPFGESSGAVVTGAGKKKVKRNSKKKGKETSRYSESEETKNNGHNDEEENMRVEAEKPVTKVTVSPTQSNVTDNLEAKTDLQSDKMECPMDGKTEMIHHERRSRRISKEIKTTSDFVIDDPLILVDELWSDLDSDSDCTKKRTKKSRKKVARKKFSDDKKISDVNLEELLRNFGEKKPKVHEVKIRVKIRRKTSSGVDVRKTLENRVEHKSYRRLSLKLFRFNRVLKNFGRRGARLSEVKRFIRGQREKMESNELEGTNLPDLPFLAAEIKENPVQVIQCGSQKSKSAKKGPKLLEPKPRIENNLHFKISLPLESLSNMAVFNNNHLTELDVEKQTTQLADTHNIDKLNDAREMVPEKQQSPVPEEPADTSDSKGKVKRSEMIDKIFYCEICQTYYYSSSQLKTHKLSNRHKLKESEFQHDKLLEGKEPVNIDNNPTVDKDNVEECDGFGQEPALKDPVCELEAEKVPSPERMNDDTLEMPVLEGPFIENPLARMGMESTESVRPEPEPQQSDGFGFTPESLKDIQRAIGCTDEEMLILTLLGENTPALESHILDLDSCKSTSTKTNTAASEKVKSEGGKSNGLLKVDLKQRMTSALACLVNKAVINLVQKYESVAKSSVNPEAVSLLGKLSNLTKKKNILNVDELLKKPNDGETSVNTYKEVEKKEPPVSYKYQCTICGSRFEKASTRECHISRTHKGKAKKVDEVPTGQASAEEDWNDYWNYDTGDVSLGSNSQFWCSDCGINFVSPQEVLEHQKLEHQPGIKDANAVKEAGPLQSSTIGSSDEIIEGKKTKRRPKAFSSEELDQQRIIANNELRKLDRKYANKNKTNKIKWGMDALRFTVQKENKSQVAQEEKKEVEVEKVEPEVKNIDLVPKLNFTRTSNIPEFKVIQKNSLKNRFQKIIDNKLKRKSSRQHQQENETEEVETEVMLVPVVVKKKKSKKQKATKSTSKSEGEKNLDVYDFNESESEEEPVTLSHIKKPMAVSTKLKLVKVKEGPSKNKADSTTKDLVPDDYDSEDSLPLSIVKKFKPGEEDDEKDEKTSEDSVEKSEGILEQVEYLIEQLENETASVENKGDVKEVENKVVGGEAENLTLEDYKKEEKLTEESADMPRENLSLSLGNPLLEIQNFELTKEKTTGEEVDAGSNSSEMMGRNVEEPECSQSTYDDEDSMPLVLMSKKAEEVNFNKDEKKIGENTMDVSTSASEDTHLFSKKDAKTEHVTNYSSPSDSRMIPEEENARSPFPVEDEKNESKPFETLNGNVIYCRNESISTIESEYSDDGLIDSNYNTFTKEETDKSYVNEVTEKEDVVIVCSKGEGRTSNNSKGSKKSLKPGQRKKKENFKNIRKKKKRFPLLCATIEDNSFRKADKSNFNKEVIVRKIWNRQKLIGDNAFGEDSLSGSTNALESMQGNEESQTGIDKEIIVNKIWSRKKVDYESEFLEKSDEVFEDLKINKTEVSDEVVIKCGPKPIASPKRRKSKGSTSESSKETIMRKIWSGKCMFQTKAALKTYESDMLSNCKENEMSQDKAKPKKRGRPSGFSTTKRVKLDEIDKNDEDDLDSLLEEIEREQLEKAIRLEFLQLRRSEKGNVEILKEGTAPTMGLFTETSLKYQKDVSEKKKKRIKKNVRHPRQSLLKRKKFIKKPLRRFLPAEGKNVEEKANPEGNVESRECFVDKQGEMFSPESKVKNRKHKKNKHRHKHHHHKHKHKKSRHHKCLVSKHKSKHKSDVSVGDGNAEVKASSFTLLEKICQEIPDQMDHSIIRSDEMEFPFERKACDEAKVKERHQEDNVYDFAEEGSDLSVDDFKSRN